MKSKINKQMWLEILITTIFLFSMELIFKVVEKFNIFSYATIRIFLSSFLIVLLSNFLFSFIKSNQKRRICNLILLAIASIYAAAQAGFLNFIGIYMSFGTTSQIGAVTSYIIDFIESFKIEYYTIFFPLILYAIYVFIPNKRELLNEETNLFKTRIRMTSIFIVTSCLYYATLLIPFMQNDLQLITNIDLFHFPSNSSIAVNQFGPVMYGMLDIKNVILPYQDLGYSGNNNNQSTTDEPNQRHFDDTNWEKLNTNTKNTSFKNLNQYFLHRKISPKNEYTGKLKDKNVIVLMLESVNNVILNEEYFPNFARMKKNSWFWDNNYSPRNSCATINNEMSGMTSLFTINQVCTANTYKANTYFTSIFEQFNKANYQTSSFHDYDEQYYERHEIHANMGSKAYYDVNDLNFPYSTDYWEWPMDDEFIAKIIPMFTKDKPFFTWFTTVSAHQPYTMPNTTGEKYFDLFSNTNYSNEVKQYLSKVKITDDALGVLLDELEKKDLLKDTVIVLYGDHYPYKLTDDDLRQIIDDDLDELFKRDKTPFMIYNPSLKEETFHENTSYMNIAPTLANLFDLDYDPRLYMGEDLFSKDYSNRVIFADGSWEDSVAKYNALTSEVSYLGEKTYSIEELKTINNEVTNKIRMSNLAITTNYFDYLQSGLKKMEEE